LRARERFGLHPDLLVARKGLDAYSAEIDALDRSARWSRTTMMPTAIDHDHGFAGQVNTNGSRVSRQQTATGNQQLS
jgi:hypothetical protein